jgi:hypothetical protein
MVVAALATATGCGSGRSLPTDEATRYYTGIYALDSQLMHALRARDAEKVQKALADGETSLRKIKSPEWARSDHALLTKEWAQLASDVADAQDDPGAGFEEAVGADTRQISATTARLAAAATAHRARG